MTRPLISSEMEPAQKFVQFLQMQGKNITEVRVMDARTWIEFYFKNESSLQMEKDELIGLSQGDGNISSIVDKLVTSSACVASASFSVEDTQRFFHEKFLAEAQQSRVSRDTVLALYAWNKIRHCIKFQKNKMIFVR
jgi:hypothetical protein